MAMSDDLYFVIRYMIYISTVFGYSFVHNRKFSLLVWINDPH